ncbi:hypothetical protein AVEN_248294-1 [Araneus ventricosus]|uniref:Mos1 transposase HTH domain-containing protein n=1 Tax=Araneus ventricosus TaxID=182803 RepID=A0A4Y2FFD3_ARAVE|nr:hypothetical protein AVEN_248294-1 [Araneus ventricosus]
MGQGKNPFDIHLELLEVYGENVMSLKQVYVWCNSFASGRSTVIDDDRSGRAATSNREKWQATSPRRSTSKKWQPQQPNRAKKWQAQQPNRSKKWQA